MKRILLIAFICLLSFSSFAQFGFGIQAGISHSKPFFNNSYQFVYGYNIEGIQRLYFAAFADYQISKLFFIQSGIQYSGKGAVYSTELTNVVFEEKKYDK